MWRRRLRYTSFIPSTVWEVSRSDVGKYVIRHKSRWSYWPYRSRTVVQATSTLTTCDQLYRPCRTMEIDPKFCDVIKNRYKEATGIEPAFISRLV
jgi:hypothetical protein